MNSSIALEGDPGLMAPVSPLVREALERTREMVNTPSPIANITAAQSRARTCNPTCFLNREACRDFLLEHAKGTRAHRFERVSAETLHQVNEEVRRFMIGLVRRLPSKGKTI